MKIVPARPDGLGRHRVSYRWLILRLIGAGLLIATGAIHLDLYVTGYRTIPTIGWLFLLQLITAFALGALVLVSVSRLLSLMGAGFAVATLSGYLFSLRIGLFGFREVRTTAGIVAGVFELASFASLTAFVLRPANEPQSADVSSRITGWEERMPAVIRASRLAALALLGVAGVLFGLSLASTGSVPTGGGSSNVLVRIKVLHGLPVLTNASGLTLYWFAPDSPTKSTCYGTCAAYWPPLIGSPSAGPGVSGTLGTISRQGGMIQVTYDGHPLYTYIGDSAPGQNSGNNVNLNGGLWHEMAAAR